MEDLHLKPQLSLFSEIKPHRSRTNPAVFSRPTAKQRQPSCIYFGYRSLKEGLEFRLFFKWEDGKEFTEAGGRFHGAYRGHSRVLKAHAAILRWLWADLHDDTGWPPQLMRKTAPSQFLIPWPSRGEGSKHSMTMLHLELCLGGLKPLPEIVLPHEEPDFFLQKIWLDDHIALNSFFCFSATRLRRDRVQDFFAPRKSHVAEPLEATQHRFPDLALEIQ